MDNLLKTSAQIQIMQKGGKKISRIFNQLAAMVKEGVNLLTIEKKAQFLIKKAGGKPAFARVPGYHWATCLNVNEGIVHGVPRSYVIKKGDVVNIDLGFYFQGFNTDMSATFYVEKNNDSADLKIKKFLTAGRKALYEAIKQARPGNRVGSISQTIQKIIEENGYNVARNLTGHGIGRKLHEPPSIPCFLKEKINKTPLLKTGMTLAIEVIYMMGKPDLVVDQNDGWTIRTKDGKIAAVFEQTIAITQKGPIVLAKIPC